MPGAFIPSRARKKRATRNLDPEKLLASSRKKWLIASSCRLPSSSRKRRRSKSAPLTSSVSLPYCRLSLRERTCFRGAKGDKLRHFPLTGGLGVSQPAESSPGFPRDLEFRCSGGDDFQNLPGIHAADVFQGLDGPQRLQLTCRETLLRICFQDLFQAAAGLAGRISGKRATQRGLGQFYLHRQFLNGFL